jgi:hypothetical protein
VNTYTQGEHDDSLTGVGQTHLKDYLFQHKVAAQPEAVEYIMRPAAHGFQKRFHVTFSPSNPPSDEDHLDGGAREFLKELHTYLFSNVANVTCKNVMGTHARTMYKAAKNAVKDFVEEKGNTLHGKTNAKLGFADSDIMRYCNTRMRIAQFCCSLAENLTDGELDEERARNAFDVFELAMALHQWRRQVHIHHSYYRWWDLHSDDLMPDRQLKGALERAQPAAGLKLPELELLDQASCKTVLCFFTYTTYHV